jgi:hypothetical protein
MANKHVSLVVRTELASMLQACSAPRADGLPKTFSYPANPDALRVALSTGALQAGHSRYANDAALEAYALPFVRDWLTQKQRDASTALQKAFADEIAINLHPVGSRFDRYIARFFEDSSTALAYPGAIAAVVVRSADVVDLAKSRASAFTVYGVIYELALQRRLLDAFYERFEQYYFAAVDRFGPRHSETILPSCCDALRAALGPLMLRLRDPLRIGEREWLALARYRKPDGHVVMGDVEVPWLGLHCQRAGRTTGLPLDVVLAPSVDSSANYRK